MVKSNKRRSIGKLKPRPVGSKSPPGVDGLDVMNSARRKLKGALQDLMPHSDDESSSDDDRPHWNSAAIKRARRDLGGGGRSRQGIGTDKSGTGGEGFKNSFIMKLFDRTVDLSNYTESTPLYPICRAWIANSSLYSFNRKSDDKEDKNDLDDNVERKSGDIYKLPSPSHIIDSGEKIRVPKPIYYKTEYPDMAQPDGEGDNEAPSRDQLLADNLSHWIKVRNSWKQASRDNEQRYANSIDILTNMFYNAQKNL